MKLLSTLFGFVAKGATALLGGWQAYVAAALAAGLAAGFATHRLDAWRYGAQIEAQKAINAQFAGAVASRAAQAATAALATTVAVQSATAAISATNAQELAHVSNAAAALHHRLLGASLRVSEPVFGRAPDGGKLPEIAALPELRIRIADELPEPAVDDLIGLAADADRDRVQLASCGRWLNAAVAAIDRPTPAAK